MDAAQLVALTDTVVQEFDDHRILKQFGAVANAYTNSVQSPNTDTAGALDEAIRAFEDAVDRMTQPTPSRIAMLERLYAADLVGAGLKERVRLVLGPNVTPARVVAALEELRSRLAKFRADAETVRNGLLAIGLQKVEITPGEAEAEFILPGKLFGDSLGGLARESKKLDGALLDLVEAATGSRPPLAIQAISTGSLDIVIKIDAVSAGLILSVTVQILQGITSMLEIRKIHADLKRLGAPEQTLRLQDEWYKKKIDEKLDAIKSAVLAEIKDPPRRAELDNSGSVARAIAYLADRVDRGMRVNIEIAPTESEAGAETSATLPAAVAELQREMLELSAKVKQIGNAESVLGLPPAPDTED